MYNLHSHSLLSDGVLLPSEVAMRYLSAGYDVIAITDHADYSNIDFLTSAILEFIRHWPKDSKINVLPGIELTHLPLEQFIPLAKLARKKGMKIIIGHGETVAEPMVLGTNRAALEADIDILAHPGFISNEDADFAAKRGIFLEITSRKGHKKTNTHVAKQALRAGAKLILSTDSHMPQDIIKPQMLFRVAFEAGLSKKDLDTICKNVKGLLKNTKNS